MNILLLMGLYFSLCACRDGSHGLVTLIDVIYIYVNVCPSSKRLGKETKRGKGDELPILLVNSGKEVTNIYKLFVLLFTLSSILLLDSFVLL